ncbi:MAG: hypothetical protein M0Z70_12130 [Nitrospiraceae bacterium]|jgi:hypothetical protein|nr:hypothetical protein [Nitrospiraceae bacterium]
MSIPYEKIIRDIQRVTSWGNFSRIRKYFDSHVDDYTEDQVDGIATAIETKLGYFDPADCSILSGIELIDDRHVIIHQDEAQSICADAHNADMTLPDFLLSVYPSFRDFQLQERQVSAYEKRLAKEIFGVAQEKITPAEKEEGVMRLEVDKSALLNEIQRLRTEFSEEAEDLRSVFEKEIRELNAQIGKLRSGEPVAKSEVQEPYKQTKVIDSIEYRIATKLLARKGAKPFLLRVERRGRNEYSITLQGMEKDVTEFLAEVANRAQELRKERSKTVGNLASNRPVEEQYSGACAAYTQSTGRKCNRYVGWIAEQIIRVKKEEMKEHYDEQLIDWTVIDWTMGSGGPMTAERAAEVFSAWLASYRRGEEMNKRLSTEPTVDLLTEYETFAEYLALIELRQEYGKTDEKTLSADRDILQEFGLTPASLPTQMREADAYLEREVHSSLQEEIDRIKKKYKLRLGIEDGGKGNA